MTETTSASKGCFVFKGSQKNQFKRSPRKKEKETKNFSFMNVFSDCDKTSAVQRYETYKQMWSYMESKTRTLIAESHSSLLRDIVSFVAQHSPENQRIRHSSIPTAFVTLGVNIPDHAVFFSLLETSLQEHCTPYIAMINSKEATTLKIIVEKVLQRLMKAPQQNFSEEDSELQDEAGVPIVKPKHKSLQSLVEWYEGRDKKPLVVVFQDLEAFGQQQLQDFVLLCREYWNLHKLPLTFIMGVATATVAQQQLHHRTAVSLWTRSFQSQPSVTLLNELMENLIMDSPKDQLVLRLGPRLIRLLLDAFLYHDLSVNSFVQRLHLIVLQHFISLPQSLLCCSFSDLQKRVNILNKDQLELFRELPSFMKYVEDDKSRSSAVLLIDDKKFCDFLISALNDIEEHGVVLAAHCRILYALCAELPGVAFGKTLREIYCYVLSNPLKETEEWNQFVQLVKLLSAPELELRLEQCLAAAKSLKRKNKTVADSEQQISDIISSLQNLRNEDIKQNSPNREKPKTMLNLQGKKLNRFQLQEQLLASAKQGKRSLSPFETIREDLVRWINSILVECLRRPSDLPFNEIIYAGNVAQGQWDIIPFMRRQIQPVPRIAIHKGLTDPHAYLRCTCCENSGEVGCLLPSMPDISIAYKLHTECGRLINLYDWMTAFNSIASTEENEEEVAVIDQVVQARFVRAVSELQFLGFVQSSKRKMDHVARLTWGV